MLLPTGVQFPEFDDWFVVDVCEDTGQTHESFLVHNEGARRGLDDSAKFHTTGVVGSSSNRFHAIYKIGKNIKTI